MYKWSKEKLYEEYYDKANFFQEKNFVENISDVPVTGKCIGKQELQNMVEASLDGWLTTGRFNKEFENDRVTKKLLDKQKFIASISGYFIYKI